MKKNDLAILIATALYTFLFYQQSLGLNLFIFTILLTGIMAVLNPKAIKNKKWLLIAGLTILSAIFVLMYGSTLAIWANIVSLIALTAYSVNSSSSFIFNMLSGVLSILSSVFFLIINNIPKEQGSTEKGYVKKLTYIIPILLSIIFFFIYRNVNPLFEKYTAEINLDFLSIAWIFFTFGGFLICYGYIKHQRIEGLDNYENVLTDNINPSYLSASKWNEKTAVAILFFILNLMLLFINGLDVKYLYLGAGLPEGVTHKQFVHNGVGMLILSIVLAISILLYFFRGSLNFDKQNKFAKALVYLWIAQNLMMVLSTSIRNNMYVVDGLLTYKRIGVYYWLLLAAIGLIITYYKIAKTKSNWFLLKANVFALYLILVFSASVDWDKFISDYNISFIKCVAGLDKKYLISLSETNIPQLYALKNCDEFNTDSAYHYEYYTSDNYLALDNRGKLDYKLFQYLKDIENKGWQSFTFRKSRVNKEVEELNRLEKISEFNISGQYINNISPLNSISNIKKLNLSNTYFDSLSQFKNFQKLESLNLNGNRMISIDSLPEMNGLKQLSLYQNEINNIKHICVARNLEELNLSNNRLYDLGDMAELKKLSKLTLDNNPIYDFMALAKLPKLAWLSMNTINTNASTFPTIKNIQHLELNGAANLAKMVLSANYELKDLEYLSMTNNSIKTLDMLAVKNEKTELLSSRYPNLKELYINENKISNIDYLGKYLNLETLDASTNNIYSAQALATLSKLKSLNLSSNHIEQVNFITNLKDLQDLNLQSNPISDFTALRNLKKLIWLDVSSTKFNNLKLIRPNSNLHYIDLSNCLLQNLKGIENFKMLQSLSVSHLLATDIQYVKQLKRLKNINVSYSSQKTITLLREALKGTGVNVIEN